MLSLLLSLLRSFFAPANPPSFLPFFPFPLPLPCFIYPFLSYREHIAWLELGELSALGNDAADPTGKAGKKKELGVCLEVETIQDAFGRMKAGVLSFSKYVVAYYAQ